MPRVAALDNVGPVTDALDLRLVRADTFEPHLGSEFVSLDPAASFVLVDVTSFAVQPHAPRPEPFALMFVGAPGLAQGLYELEHQSLGRLDIFIVPVALGPDGSGRYEAIFN
jgi:uncharacterized protein DUF6916